MSKIEEIAKWYKENIKTSDEFNTKSPCNNIDLLFPEFRSLIETMIKEYFEVHQTEPYILETYRSNDLQKVYYNRGASKIRKDGMHHFGIAVDLVGKDEDGHIDYDVLDYQWLRTWAQKNDIVVLNWELAHFQYISVSNQQTLRNACNSED